jgi:branched-chain amino acid transport system substrate-binding protein
MKGWEAVLKAKRIIHGSLMVGLSLLLLLSACSKPAKSQEIVIGVVWPFSDKNDLFNEGIDLAVREINDSGGINGKKLILLKEDDDSDVVTGLNIAEAFAENTAVSAVIGHRSSFISIPAAAIYEQTGLTMLTPASTDPELTEKDYQHVFRCIPSDDEIARKLAEHLGEQGYKRMVVFYSDDAYGRDLAASFEDQAKRYGITVVDRFCDYADAEELKRLDRRWQAFGYDGIFIAAAMQAGAQLLRDAGQAGISGPFAAGNALETTELPAAGGAAAEGIVVGSVFDPGSDRPEVKSFISAFRETYQQEPGAYAALGYDAVKMLAAAMAKVEAEDRQAVAEGLKNLGPWQGVCGVHELDGAGNELGDLIILKQLQDGKFVILKG